MADAFVEPNEDEPNNEEMAQLMAEFLAHVSVEPRVAANRRVPAEALSTSCEGDLGWSYSEVRRQIDDRLRWGYTERSLSSREDDTISGLLDPLEMIAVGSDPVDCWRMAAEYIQTLAIEVFEAKHRIAKLERYLRLEGDFSTRHWAQDRADEELNERERADQGP